MSSKRRKEPIQSPAVSGLIVRKPQVSSAMWRACLASLPSKIVRDIAWTLSAAVLATPQPPSAIPTIARRRLCGLQNPMRLHVLRDVGDWWRPGGDPSKKQETGPVAGFLIRSVFSVYLENRCTGNRTVGLNPTLSARPSVRHRPQMSGRSCGPISRLL